MNKIILFSLLIACTKSPISAQSSNTAPQKLDSIVGYSWYQNNFVISSVETFNYNPGGKLSQQSVFYYNDYPNSINYATKSNYSYDPQGNQVETVQYELNTSNNVFETKYKSEYIYNSQNNRIQSIYYNWNQNNSQWFARGKDSTYFDVNNNNILRISFLRDQVTGQWWYSDKQESSYNANNDLTLYQYWSYNIDSLQWFQIERSSYLNDANGNVLQFIRESAFQDGDTLTPYYKETYGYNSNGYQNTIRTFFWSTAQNHWRKAQKKERYFNIYNDADSNINMGWNNNSWTNQNYTTSQFNNSISGVSILLPSVIGNDYAYIHTNKQLTKRNFYSWDKNSSVWEELGFTNFYYSDFITSVTEVITKNELSVYPNPTTNTITFSLPSSTVPASLVLMDIQGRIILTKKIGYSTPVNVSQFKNGLYFYKVEVNGEVFVGRVIKL